MNPSLSSIQRLGAAWTPSVTPVFKACTSLQFRALVVNNVFVRVGLTQRRLNEAEHSACYT